MFLLPAAIACVLPMREVVLDHARFPGMLRNGWRGSGARCCAIHPVTIAVGREVPLFASRLLEVVPAPGKHIVARYFQCPDR